MSSTDRLCDFCAKSKALLYCRADSAKLCLGCDREVHSTNQLFTKHTRWLLCDSCHSSPASIFCGTHASVFCQNCDWEAHRPGPGPHDRRPLEGFTGCPSVSEFLGLLCLDYLGKKALSVEDDEKHEKEINDPGVQNDDDKNNVDMDLGLVDLLGWDGPAVVSIDELIGSGGDDSVPAHNFQAIGVAPLPKNRNAVCGQYKDEILHQLREMSKSEPGCEGCVDSLVDVQSQTQQKWLSEDRDSGFDCNLEPTFIHPYETNAFKWCARENEVTDEALIRSYMDTNYLVPEKESEFGDSSAHLDDGSSHLIQTENLHIVPKVAPRELNSQERDSAISRYKEKKKTRRYDKHIRYESRKVRAESRKRINGRFARKDNTAAAT